MTVIPTEIPPNALLASSGSPMWLADWGAPPDATPHLDYLSDYDNVAPDYGMSHVHWQAPQDKTLGYLRFGFPATNIPADADTIRVQFWNDYYNGNMGGPYDIFGHLKLGTSMSLETYNLAGGAVNQTLGGTFVYAPGEWPLYNYEFNKADHPGFDEWVAQMRAGTAFVDLTFQYDPTETPIEPSDSYTYQLQVIAMVDSTPVVPVIEYVDDGVRRIFWGQP